LATWISFAAFAPRAAWLAEAYRVGAQEHLRR
jgi:hypothetical protein